MDSPPTQAPIEEGVPPKGEIAYGVGTQIQTTQQEALRNRIQEHLNDACRLAEALRDLAPSRELALTITKLEEARFWISMAPV